MAKKDIANLDASVRAVSELQSVMKQQNSTGEKRISVEAALHAPRVAKSDEGRTALRVLFITQDEHLLNPDLQSLDGFLRLKDLFEEVHIMVLREGIPARTPILRPDKNVWLYIASATHWYQTPKVAIALAKEQLTFGTGFRPDLIVARDPFESALVAKKLGALYGRPTQLHVLEEYTSAAFIKKHPHNRWRRFLPRFTIQTFLSVRTATDALALQLQKKFSIKDLAVLPRYHDYQSQIATKEAMALDVRYKPFLFFMVYVGSLHHDSRLYRAIDAARPVLKNPRVCLIVLGDGVARPEFERRAKILGIEKQVIFEKRVTDYIPYVKAAHLVIVPDVTGESEEIVHVAAAAGVPVVMAKTPHRTDIFEDGVSGYLCEGDDIQQFSDRITAILENLSLRKVIGGGGQAAVERRFHQNPQTYKDAYQKSIEEALFIE